MSAEVIYLDKVFDKTTPLVSLDDARALGLKRYFTGKPCKHGHVAERRTDSRVCVMCEASKTAKWRASNPERNKECWKKYADVNREKLRDRDKKRHAANPDATRMRNEKFRAKNPDYFSIHLQANLDKHLANQSRRRARKSNVIVTPDADSIVRRISSEDAFCFYCDVLLLAKEAHVDHVIPLAQGGPHAAINFVASCAGCNQRKGSKRPSEWPRLPKRKADHAIARENEIAAWIANYVLGDE